MKRAHTTLKVAGYLVALMISCKVALAQQPPDDVGGNWTIYSTSIETGATVVKRVQIAQYGESLTGFFEGPEQAGPIQGSIHGHHVEFKTKTRNVLSFRGTVNGSIMSGLWGLHGRHAGWQAVRATGAGLAVQVPPVTSNQYQPAQVQAPPAPQVAPQTAPEPTAMPDAPGGGDPPPAAQSPEQLNALVAPIALYPDALVAQILAASTFSDQVAVADNWLSQNSSLTGADLAEAVDQQTWDPSVKALTQFPTVLDNLAKNLSWTSSLGQAFQYQQADVMAAVQAMRAKAQAAGTLQSTPQITVTKPSPSVIVIQPANPQVVYVPLYNPTIVYGAPVVVPFYTPPVLVTATALSFGPAIVIGGVFGGGGGFVAGGGFGWGFHAWAMNWGRGGGGSTIIYNHTTYINSHNGGYHRWAGGAAGSQNHAWYGSNGTFHPDGNYRPGVDTHYGPNGAYHPNGYFGPHGGWHADKPGTGPNNMPNGGNNGNHGLIGGKGGVQNPNASLNGPSVAPAGGHHDNSSNGGAQKQAATTANRPPASNSGSSRKSDGAGSRAENRRGHPSEAGRHPDRHVAKEHAAAQHHERRAGEGR